MPPHAPLYFLTFAYQAIESRLQLVMDTESSVATIVSYVSAVLSDRIFPVFGLDIYVLAKPSFSLRLREVFRTYFHFLIPRPASNLTWLEVPVRTAGVYSYGLRLRFGYHGGVCGCDMMMTMIMMIMMMMMMIKKKREHWKIAFLVPVFRVGLDVTRWQATVLQGVSYWIIKTQRR